MTGTTRTNRAGAKTVVLAGLFGALLAASAWIAIPVGTAVPLTLQVFIVVLATLVLPPRQAVAAIGTYLVLGAIGVPVFSGARGGLGVLAGPTGGYLWGFLVAAGAGSAIRLTLEARAGKAAADAAAALAAVTAIYLAGWVQLAMVTQMGPALAFAQGVAPFVAVDVAKAAAAIAVAAALRRAGVAPRSAAAR